MIYWILSFSLGAIAVLQGGLNRQIAREWGLSVAIFMNAFLLLILATLFILVCYFYPQYFNQVFSPKVNFSEPATTGHNSWQTFLTQWRWWFMIPAFCGFALVSGIPALIPKLGAAGVFLCIVVGQMVFSLLWDLKIEAMPPDPKKLLGVALAFLGLMISYWK